MSNAFHWRKENAPVLFIARRPRIYKINGLVTPKRQPGAITLTNAIQGEKDACRNSSIRLGIS